MCWDLKVVNACKTLLQLILDEPILLIHLTCVSKLWFQLMVQKNATLRIMGSPNWLFRDHCILLYRGKMFFWGWVQWFFWKCHFLFHLTFSSKLETLLVSLFEIGSPTIRPFVPKERFIVWLCDGYPDTRHQQKYAAGLINMQITVSGSIRTQWDVFGYVWLWYHFQHSIQSYTTCSLFMHLYTSRLTFLLPGTHFVFFNWTTDLGIA